MKEVQESRLRIWQKRATRAVEVVAKNHDLPDVELLEMLVDPCYWPCVNDALTTAT